MSLHRPRTLARNGERGVTMLLMVIAMFSMLAMVALAVDVITLYSARSEAQRAADSAALAAAKMLVDSGVTGDPTNTSLQGSAQGWAIEIAKDVAAQAMIGGQGIVPTNVNVTFPNGTDSARFAINPTVNVVVKATNLPAFFSRIWNRNPLTVSASATAEGFNPSNSGTIATGGAAVPPVARCVKPFLLPNCDPVNPNNQAARCGGTFATFFDPTTGALTNPGQSPAGVIGETFHLMSNCGPGPACTFGPPAVTPTGPGGTILYYYPAQIGTSGNACPASCGGGGTTLEDDIECCNTTALTCGTTTTATIFNQVTPDASVYPDGGGGPAQDGVQCLIHQSPGNGQDILNENVLPAALNYPLQIQVGNNHPLARTPSLTANNYVTTSDSLVTVPVFDTGTTPLPVSGTAVNIIGFLQLFIVQAFPGGGGPKAGEFEVTVVNVMGCGSSATGTPVFSGASSPLAVRLVR